jgi:site-specific recombinase XerC
MATAPPIPKIVTRGDLAGNVESLARHLRAANLTPATQRTYLASLDRLARFLEASGMPTDVGAIRREHVEAFMEDQLARWKPATAANRYSGIRPFFTWLVEEGEIKASPMERMRKPNLPEHARPIPPDADVERLLAACAGPSFADRRDTAILRTLVGRLTELSPRASEVAALRLRPL